MGGGSLSLNIHPHLHTVHTYMLTYINTEYIKHGQNHIYFFININ
jgi:hypothetical protein